MIDREVTKEPIFCEHCGDLPQEFVEYNDGCGWCPTCAYANGAISEDQLRQDELDSAEVALVYLEARTKILKRILLAGGRYR